MHARSCKARRQLTTPARPLGHCAARMPPGPPLADAAPVARLSPTELPRPSRQHLPPQTQPSPPTPCRTKRSVDVEEEGLCPSHRSPPRLQAPRAKQRRKGELCRGRADGGINDSTVGTLWSQSRDNPVRTRGAFQSCLHWGPAKSTSGQRRGAWLTSGQAEAEGKGTTQCGVRHTPAQGRALGPAAATGGGWGPTVRDNLWPVLVPVTPGRYIF